MTRRRSRMDVMEPYYVGVGGGIKLYLGSCLDIPEKWTHATALITDPPYGVNYKILLRGGMLDMLLESVWNGIFRKSPGL